MGESLNAHSSRRQAALDDHQRHDRDQRDQEREPAGARGVVDLNGVVDRERRRLRQAGDVAGDHQRRPEVSEGPGEGEDDSGGQATPGQG